MSRLSRDDKLFVGSLLIPSIFLLSLVEFIPIFYALTFSFTESSIFKPSLDVLVGLKNYVTIISSNVFWKDVANTLFYGSITAIIQTLIGLGLALLLTAKRGWLSTFIKALIFLPYALPYVSVALVWRFLLDPQYGTINKFLFLLGLVNSPVDFFGTPNYAMWSCILVTVWQFYPFALIILLAAIDTVPKDLVEAAQIDGAGKIQVFRNVTWPHISRIFFITLFLRFLFNSGKFDHIWLLTGGGPLGATETLPIITWITAFRQYNYGLATAIAILNVLILIPFLIIFLLTVYRRG